MKRRAAAKRASKGRVCVDACADGELVAGNDLGDNVDPSRTPMARRGDNRAPSDSIDPSFASSEPSAAAETTVRLSKRRLLEAEV